VAARDADGLVRQTAAALGLALAPTASLDERIAQLGRALARLGECLVVLDNFEQVAEHGAETVARWHQQAPQSRWIVTSRIRLNLRHEWVHEVLPLGPSAGADLFMRRARAVGAQLSEADGPAVAALVRRLDGIPLAIELAAARSRVLSPQQILERLGESLTWLGAGPRDTVPRHDTVHHTVAWSWALLGPDAQRALCSLSVFRGGFDLDAAEAVLDLTASPDAPGLLGLVQTLLDHSMVHRSADGPGLRAFGLYEVVRAFVRQRLDQSGDREAVEAAHAAWVLGLGEAMARELHGPGAVQARVGLQSIQDDLQAAHERARGLRPDDVLRTALVLDRLLDLTGPLETRLGVLDAGAEALATSGSVALAGPLYLARARARHRQALTPAVGEDIERALACSGDRDRSTAGRARVLRGWLAVVRGDLAAATDDLERGLEILIEAGDVPGEVDAVERLGEVQRRQGRLDAAEALLRRGLRLNGRTGDARGQAWSLARLSGLRFTQGRFADARALYGEAMPLFDACGDSLGALIARINLGMTSHREGLLAEARDAHQAALVLAQDCAGAEAEARIRSDLGHVLVNLDERDEALAQLNQALAVFQRHDDPRAIALVWDHLALLAWRQGELSRAQRLSADAVALGEGRGASPTVLGSRCFTGALQHRLGDPAAALQTYAGCREPLQGIGDRSALALLDAREAVALADSGDLAEASERLAQGQALAQGADPPTAQALAVHAAHVAWAGGRRGPELDAILGRRRDGPLSGRVFVALELFSAGVAGR